ncbi:MAG: PfkB family carbohydrate kinase, partial [Saprospiraceae bacterium]|nr:PfkB family carbohydrate kinase [Saprospiraceae bacterium]
TTKTRVISGHQHLLRVDEESVYQLENDDAQRFRDQISHHLGSNRPDAVILQDYNKGVLSADVIAHILHETGEYGIPVMVDPKYAHFYDYRGVTMFKPNLRELRASVPFAVTIDKGSLDRAAEYLSERLKHVMTCVTLSESGIYIHDSTGSQIYPTVAHDVVDVCGAGDGVISVLTVAYLARLEASSMARLANVAGGLVCEEVGVSTVPLEGLKQALQQQTFS